jgi:hypothetical protein
MVISANDVAHNSFCHVELVLFPEPCIFCCEIVYNEGPLALQTRYYPTERVAESVACHPPVSTNVIDGRAQNDWSVCRIFIVDGDGGSQ